MFHIVLYQPEIPPNTGNAIRLSANVGARLHLIEPLGFEMSDKALARAGLDYHQLTHVQTHADWAAFRASVPEGQIYAVTTRGGRGFNEVRYRPGDVLLFGCETRGLPAEMLARLSDGQRVRIPMRPGNRSLNLSNAVAVVAYEAWRQQGYEGGA
ncbi:MAG: tRNA (cytidine(34)-2'-O)-methyltransferase [Denitromonas halophila]|nr:MAG: tRNA (cytidine(34)-2'-O)-methyltransferase [Denitromonas halophila]